MLKIAYIDTGVLVEHSAQSLDMWISQRAILALRLGQPLQIEPCTASLTVPADLADQYGLHQVAGSSDRSLVSLCLCDFNLLEVSVQGTWVSSQRDEAEGLLVAQLSDRLEGLLASLWQASQHSVSSFPG